MVSVQNEYGPLYRLYDTDMAEVGQKEGVTLLAYSPLAAGLLTGKYAEGEPDGSRAAVDRAAGGSGDLGGRRAVAEEAAEERIVHQRIAVLDGLGSRHSDDRRRHPLHDRRIRHAQRLGRRRHHALLGRGRLRRQQARREGGKQAQTKGHDRPIPLGNPRDIGPAKRQ